jgi:hypothetical protein
MRVDRGVCFCVVCLLFFFFGQVGFQEDMGNSYNFGFGIVFGHHLLEFKTLD